MTNRDSHIHRNTFTKAERLCSETIIAGLFKPGFFVSSYPIRINAVFMDLPIPGVPAQVVFSVGKKKFPKATDRNQIRRILRELYRVQKQPLYDALKIAGKRAAIAVIYTGKDIPSHNELSPVFTKLVNKFCHAIPTE
jgi:ribonuclease P protein component